MDTSLSFDEIRQKYVTEEQYEYYSGFVELVFDNLQKINPESFTISSFCKQVVNLFAIREKQFNPDIDCYKSNLLAVSYLLLDLYTEKKSIEFASRLSGIIFWKQPNYLNGRILMVGLTDLFKYAKLKESIKQNSKRN